MYILSHYMATFLLSFPRVPYTMFTRAYIYVYANIKEKNCTKAFYRCNPPHAHAHPQAFIYKRTKTLYDGNK